MRTGLIVVGLALGAVIALTALLPRDERPDHLRDGNVYADGKLYGPPPSEQAFEEQAIADPAAARLASSWRRLGHFYCSRKPASPEIPAGVHYPPIFLADVFPDLAAYWFRLGEEVHDDVIARREEDAIAAWEDLGGEHPASGSEVTWMRVVTAEAEWTLCPDGRPNPYAGRDYRPGSATADNAGLSPYQQFTALAQRSGIDMRRHASYTQAYFDARATTFCNLLGQGGFVEISREVTFPPVTQMTETPEDRPRLETAIMRVGATLICPQNADKERQWEQQNVR